MSKKLSESAEYKGCECYIGESHLNTALGVARKEKRKNESRPYKL